MSTSPFLPYRYSAYGLTIASELECPELVPAPVAGEADVTIRLGELPPRMDAPHVRQGRFQLGEGTVQVLVDDVARYRISDGRAIVVSPLPGADAGDVRLFLLGLVLGTLLLQSGRFTLHASAVNVAGRAVAFCGHSGAGKSTLATALHHLGHPLLCDDIGVVVPAGDGSYRFHPGFPRIKLWRDAMAHFAIDPHGLERAGSREDKFQLRLRDTFQCDPLPLHAIHFLELAAPGEPGAVLPLAGAEGVMRLSRDSYRPQLAQALGSVRGHLRQCSDIARAVHLYRYARPWEMGRLEQSLAPLLATFATQGTETPAARFRQ